MLKCVLVVLIAVVSKATEQDRRGFHDARCKKGTPWNLSQRRT